MRPIIKILIILIFFIVSIGLSYAQNAQDYKKRGDDFLEKGQFSDAVLNYDKAISINPNEIGLYLSRAIANAKLKQFEKAILDLSYIIDKGYADLPFLGLGPDIYYSRGSLYLDTGNYDKAISDYSKAIEVASQLINNVRQQKQQALSIDFTPSLRNTLINSYNVRAFIYYKTGKYENAVQDYTKLIDLTSENPNRDPIIYRYRGMAYEKLGKKNEAQNDFKLFEKLNTNKK